ncbi:X-box-binding protein 1 isoform X2 [Cuculus canorus]|uniref:X-box-binding protein 1 isoform X2 n=1 Tax=Cuculus canorus TaxID=55661 RepID=UPI0023AA4462|nr:X-box-binding protein 1 isoform X2 [Cuculus canorus]
MAAAVPRLLLIPAPGPEAPQPARKRQRLTHLSPEEKALRRKLKNRVAAQSARDRKKARMAELEQQVLELEEENQKLLLENRLLQEKTCNLAVENQELRSRLGLDVLKMEEEEEESKNRVRSTQTTCSSAAGAGPAVTTSDHFHMDSDGSDSSDAESDLLLGFLDSLDPEMFLKYADSESRCLEKLEEKISGETNSIPASPSPSLGSSSAKLEAINELIRFDHVYTKPLILEVPVKAGNPTNMLVKIEEVPLFASEDKAVPEVPVSVKEEPVDSFMPELGLSHLLSSPRSPAASSYFFDACSDSGYEGSPSPFSNLPSPLDIDCAWEDSFANELFPQLISV